MFGTLIEAKMVDDGWIDMKKQRQSEEPVRRHTLTPSLYEISRTLVAPDLFPLDVICMCTTVVLKWKREVQGSLGRAVL